MTKLVSHILMEKPNFLLGEENGFLAPSPTGYGSGLVARCAQHEHISNSLDPRRGAAQICRQRFLGQRARS